MRNPSRSVGRAAKSMLCVGLTLNPYLWATGCGSTWLPSPDGFTRITLPSDHALVRATNGTTFAGVTAIEVNPSSRQFRLVLPDDGQRIEGMYQSLNGRAAVTSVRLAVGEQFVELTFDDNKHITSANLPGGQVWTPTDSDADVGAALGSSGVDGYVAANQELVDAARGRGNATGGGGGGGGGSSGGAGNPAGAKLAAASQVSDVPIQNFLAQLSIIMGLVAYWPVLFTGFLVVEGIDLALGLLNNPPASGGSTGGAADPTAAGIVADSTLRVRNNLTTVPIWYVVLFEVPAARLPGGNLLGQEAIPAGASRDFGIPAGTRTFNIVVPEGERCLIIHNRKEVRLKSGAVTEIVISSSDQGELYPTSCQ